jgi:hypothetical protein
VLHVEKHGLQIRETSVAIHHGRNSHITSDDRRLFQYSFQEVGSDFSVSEEDLNRLRPVMDARPASGPRLLLYALPRRWNADRWFIYSQGRPIPSLFNIEKSAVPAEILAWFYKVQALDQMRTNQDTERDVCLGFCYNPMY